MTLGRQGATGNTAKEMALDDFIAGTLVAIIEGVRKAQRESDKTGAIISPGALVNNVGQVGVSGKGLVKDVNFDIAITTGSGTENGVKIGVLSIIALGAEGRSKSDETMTNRLSFSVPVLLPCGDQEQQG